MNFNLNALSTNYVSSQFSLNKLLNQNNNSNQNNGMGPATGAAVGQNPNLAPRFLAMNANGPANGQSNSLVNLGLASQPQPMNHCGANNNGNSNSNAFTMHRNSYGLSSTAASSASSSTSSSLSTSLTNLNFAAASAANSLNAAAQNLSNQLNLNTTSAVGNNSAAPGGNATIINNNNNSAVNPQLAAAANTSASLIASVVAAAAAENNNNNNPYNNLLANSSLPHMQSTTCSLNNTLFVGNLHASLQEIDLIQVFRPFGHIVECCKKWLHFGFVKFTTEEEACHAYVTLNGFRLKGRPMRLEFQNRTKKARIKAILAQAALQSVTSANGFRNDSLESSLASLNFSNYFPDERQQQHMQQQQQQYHNHHNQQYQNHNQQYQHQQHQQHQQHMSNYMMQGGNNNSNNCLFSNATTNSLIESLYKSVESSSSSACPNFAGPQGGPFENSFFNPEQLIKFAASNLDGGQKDQQANNCYSSSAKSHLDFNNLDFFGTTINAANNASSNSCNRQFDFGSLDKEKQIRNNLNSIINDKDNDCGGGGNGLLKPVSQKSSSSSLAPGATTQLNEESLFLHFQMKRTQLSPAISPQHDTSSSLSSDSGCRSTSFLNDEDSGFNSIAKVMANHAASNLLAVPGQQSQSQSQQQQNTENKAKLSMLDDCTLSEHLEFTTCSNSSPVKMKNGQETSDQMVANVLELDNCIKININDLEVNDLLDVDEACNNNNNNKNNNSADNQQGQEDDDDDDLESNTSNDASEMPNDADCLNDLDCMDEHFLMNGGCASAAAVAVADSAVVAVAGGEYGGSNANAYNQVVEKDGSLSQMTY